MTQTIDVTPTWAALMPALIAAVRDGTPEGQSIAIEELNKLAEAVDAQNARARAGKLDAVLFALDAKGRKSLVIRVRGGRVSCTLPNGTPCGYTYGGFQIDRDAEIGIAFSRCTEPDHLLHVAERFGSSRYTYTLQAGG